jgi:hypothetical protein
VVKAYVIFAANFDRIYIFEHADDIRKFLLKCGWEINNEWVFPIYPIDSP